MASVFAVRTNVSSLTKATVVQLWPFSVCHATHRENVLCDVSRGSHQNDDNEVARASLNIILKGKGHDILIQFVCLLNYKSVKQKSVEEIMAT